MKRTLAVFATAAAWGCTMSAALPADGQLTGVQGALLVASLFALLVANLIIACK